MTWGSYPNRPVAQAVWDAMDRCQERTGDQLWHAISAVVPIPRDAFDRIDQSAMGHVDYQHKVAIRVDEWQKEQSP